MFSHRSTPIYMASVLGLFAALTILWTIGVDLVTGLFLATFVTIPAAVLGWFVLSLVLYLRGKKADAENLPGLKSRLHVATALPVFLAIMFGLLFIFFIMAISHM